MIEAPAMATRDLSQWSFRFDMKEEDENITTSTSLLHKSHILRRLS